MEINELLKFIEIEDKRLRQKFGDYDDREKRVLARTVKLNEEVGELCNEVLANSSFQRKGKLENHNKETLNSEFADVIITALLLAKTMDIDIQDALGNKIKKINKRYK